jgi:dTDP-glucose 4,6-dehydratase/UDP-glucose 4-epimerase
MVKLKIEKKLVFSGSNRLGDPLFWQADISKIQNLGFIQKVYLEQGIENYIAWAKDFV